MDTLSNLPILPQRSEGIGEKERHRLAALAHRLLADEPRLCSTAFFGDHVAPGLGSWPGFFLEDHSAITLANRKEAERAYGYRILLLAGDGDIVAVGVSRSPGFEDYCRTLLGLGQPDIRSPAPSPGNLTSRCAQDRTLLDDVVLRARDYGGLNIIPYMSGGSLWRLAGEIAGRARVPIRVAGPPPRLSLRVNDKLWFAQRVAEVFDRRALPDAYAAFSLAALAGRLTALARRSAAVAVKLPDSASSSGNIVFEPAEVLSLPVGALAKDLPGLLARTGWQGGFPLLVTAWERPVIASPSVQLWLPTDEEGDPIVEGIFEQITLGRTQIFSGAVPTELSETWQERIAREAMQIGHLFQLLGYFGRCSFDAILVGEDETEAKLHWVECNGRWGGTSLPLTLANRLTGNWRQHPFVVLERSNLRVAPRKFESVLSELRADLYVPGRQAEGIVLLSPGQIEAGTGYELMILDKTIAAARRRAEDFEQRLHREQHEVSRRDQEKVVR